MCSDKNYKTMKKALILIIAVTMISCNQQNSKDTQSGKNTSDTHVPELNLEQANRLAGLPLDCIDQEFPNKLNQTLGTEADLKSPAKLHPAFYGCYVYFVGNDGFHSLSISF